MQRRVFLALGFGALLGGCARMKLRQSENFRNPQDGIVERPAPKRAARVTELLPEGDTLYVSGTLNSDSVRGFTALRQSHPELTRVVFLETDAAPGSAAAQDFGRALRSAGLATHLRNDSRITGGAVEAYLGGVTRSLEQGARIGVLRGGDAEAQSAYVTEMTGGDAFARFARTKGGRLRPKPMTLAQIGAMGLVTG